MNAKEKAMEIYDKLTTGTTESCKNNAKYHSLFLINEILNAINPFGQFLGKDYWEEVKKEIEKL